MKGDALELRSLHRSHQPGPAQTRQGTIVGFDSLFDQRIPGVEHMCYTLSRWRAGAHSPFRRTPSSHRAVRLRDPAIIAVMPADVDSHRTPGPNFLVAGRYRLVSRIGGGGMGTVWLARDQLLDREVAVKQVLSTEGLSEDSAETVRQRAMREGRIAARLSHRNAIAMHDVALDGGEPWLVMEYLPSRSVAQILHATGTLEVTEAAKIGAQVADAMVEAHASGIIHRDIKPGNILIAGVGVRPGWSRSPTSASPAPRTMSPSPRPA